MAGVNPAVRSYTVDVAIMALRTALNPDDGTFVGGNEYDILAIHRNSTLRTNKTLINAFIPNDTYTYRGFKYPVTQQWGWEVDLGTVIQADMGGAILLVAAGILNSGLAAGGITSLEEQFRGLCYLKMYRPGGAGGGVSGGSYEGFAHIASARFSVNQSEGPILNSGTLRGYGPLSTVPISTPF